MIIVKGEGCWLVSHTREDGRQKTYKYPLSMTREEVEYAWTMKAIRGEFTTVESQFGK